MALYVRPFEKTELLVLLRIANSRNKFYRPVVRAKIIMASARQDKVATIATNLKVSQYVVRRCIRRFNESGVSGLKDLPRPGRKPIISPIAKARIVELTVSYCGTPLSELRAMLVREGIVISRTHLWRIIRKEVSNKKGG